MDIFNSPLPIIFIAIIILAMILFQIFLISLPTVEKKRKKKQKWEIPFNFTNFTNVKHRLKDVLPGLLGTIGVYMVFLFVLHHLYPDVWGAWTKDGKNFLISHGILFLSAILFHYKKEMGGMLMFIFALIFSVSVIWENLSEYNRDFEDRYGLEVKIIELKDESIPKHIRDDVLDLKVKVAPVAFREFGRKTMEGDRMNPSEGVPVYKVNFLSELHRQEKKEAVEWFAKRLEKDLIIFDKADVEML